MEIMNTITVFETADQRKWATIAFEQFISRKEAELEKQIDNEISKLKSFEDVKKWQQHIRSQLNDILGEFPERTPLHPQIVGKIERTDIIVEKIIFESQPRYYVTANLYIPKKHPLPAPGILIPCGHAAQGKGFRLYRDAGIALARMGYVALVYDPTGQGERSECFDPKTRRHILSRTVSQHHWTGKPCFLTGMTLAGYRTWDGIRSLDYLCSRKEVDANRIGVMGNSGGGAMTLLITAVDERVKVCAAAHPGGSMENTHLRGRRPPDRRIYSLIPPRPCRIIVGRESGEEEGHRVKFEIMKPFYEACGCPERLDFVLVDGKHDLKRPKREAAYEWLNRWLERTGESAIEPRFRTISERRLWCTKNGQVIYSLNGESMFSLNRARARRLAPKRTVPRDPDKLREDLLQLRRKVAERIGFVTCTTPLEPKTLGVKKVPGGMIERLFFESEPGIPIPSLFFKPHDLRSQTPVVVHVDEKGKPTNLERKSIPVQLFKRGYPVISIDVRDTGETSCCPIIPQKRWRDFNRSRWQHDLLAIRCLGIGRTRSAMRVLDVIRTVELLREYYAFKDRKIIVVGEGRGGIWALKAALFEERINGAAAIRMLASYRLLTENRYYNQFEHFWTPGVLLDYDIVDLPALLATRPVWILDPIDHMSRRIEEEEAKKLFSYAREVYKTLGQLNSLIIKRTGGSVASVTRQLVLLLKKASFK